MPGPEPRIARLLGALLGPLALACASAAPPSADPAAVPTAESLYRQGLEKLAGGHHFWIVDTTNYKGAIDTFQDIIDNYPYSDYAVLAELQIADANFEQGLYDEALSYYRDFADLHPDHPKVPYTLYRAALCHVRQGHDASRDQTATRKALAQLDRLLRQHPFSPEAREAEGLWKELRTRLGQHALSVGDFYLERQENQSAAERFRSVLNEYPGLGLDAEALYKLGVCYTKMNRQGDAVHLFQVNLENYRDSEVADAAEALIPAAN